MAKLSAKGRSKLQTWIKAETISDSDSDLEWRKTTYAYMSDFHLLKKYEVRFKGMENSPSYHYSYGWKDTGKQSKTVEQVEQILLAKGYSRA